MALIKYPNPILNRVSTLVSIEEAKAVVTALRIAIRDECIWGHCLGLAAPQIGINKRVFIAQGEVYINPWIVARSPDYTMQEEGCYSLEDDEAYKVKRANSIIMKWQDLDGITHRDKFCDLAAEVLQHEYGHIEGELIRSGKLVKPSIVP